jgi:hypothetical protein
LVGGRRVRVRAASPVEVVRCRECGVAFSCAPPGGRHRVGYLLRVDSAVIERAERSVHAPDAESSAAADTARRHRS